MRFSHSCTFASGRLGATHSPGHVFFQEQSLRYTELVSTARNDTLCLSGASAKAVQRVSYERGSVIRRLALAMIPATLTALSAAPSQATSSQSSAPGFVNTLMP